MSATIEAKVKEIICDVLAVSAEQLKPESSFVDDLKADSLTLVELVMKLEEGCGITIPEEDIPQIKTVKNAVDYVSTHS